MVSRKRFTKDGQDHYNASDKEINVPSKRITPEKLKGGKVKVDVVKDELKVELLQGGSE